MGKQGATHDHSFHPSGTIRQYHDIGMLAMKPEVHKKQYRSPLAYTAIAVMVGRFDYSTPCVPRQLLVHRQSIAFGGHRRADIFQVVAVRVCTECKIRALKRTLQRTAPPQTVIVSLHVSLYHLGNRALY